MYDELMTRVANDFFEDGLYAKLKIKLFLLFTKSSIYSDATIQAQLRMSISMQLAAIQFTFSKFELLWRKRKLLIGLRLMQVITTLFLFIKIDILN